MAVQDQQSLGKDEARRARRGLLLKAGIAGGGILILIIALVMVESKRAGEAQRSAHVVTPESEQETVVETSPETAQSPSIADAAAQALKTSSEAAQIQSVVMAEQAATSAPAAVKEETADPTMQMPPPPPPVPVTHGKGRESGHLVLAQPASRPSSVAAPATAHPVPPAASAPAPAAAKTASASDGGFMVQVGVFANHGNAEELRNKLVAAGIPTQVETRVQIGPFEDRKAAQAAQQKLKALGLDGGMIVPAHAK